MQKALAIGIASLLISGTAVGQVTWEVVNRFPLMSDASFVSLVRAQEDKKLQAPSVAERITQVDLRGKVGHLADIAWSEKQQRYSDRVLRSFADIEARTAVGQGDCVWSLTHAATDHRQSALANCTAPVKFRVELGQGYQLAVHRVGDSNASQPVNVQVRTELIIALGDSFASGEGNPDYPAVFQTYKNLPPPDWAANWSNRDILPGLRVQSAKWLDNACHRSLLSWPALFALEKAITQSDAVIQFASFACSGAEVVDGFLLPQISPPGQKTRLIMKDRPLRLSQQQALAEFLCTGQPTAAKVVDVDGVDLFFEIYDMNLWKSEANQRKRHRTAELWGCEKPRKPDAVFVQFGGNDALFSGVVKHVMEPQELSYRFKLVAPWVANKALRAAMTPVPPDEAAKRIDYLAPLYRNLQTGLSAVNIEPSEVRLLVYPNPLESSSAAGSQREEQEFLACNRRTRDGNKALSALLARGLGPLKHDGALLGFIPKNIAATRLDYVTPLRKAQKEAKPNGWVAIDSQRAVDGRGICAGSFQCHVEGNCAKPDRVWWAYWTPERNKREYEEFVQSPRSGMWEQLSDFDAYSLERQRGFRYGNDALLTSVRLADGASEAYIDWLYGVAHPTAAVHARIARILMEQPETAAAGSSR